MVPYVIRRLTLMIFLLLFWAFRSVARAVLVLLMVPFTLIGGIAGLASEIGRAHV